jgi:hypothetical protein
MDQRLKILLKEMSSGRKTHLDLKHSIGIRKSRRSFVKGAIQR